ncbi:hypothetical protein CsSME_00042420 [Camellia sinensis var. sinensis]
MFWREFLQLKDNVSNQREHIVLLLANQQTRLGILDELEPIYTTKYISENGALLDAMDKAWVASAR